MHSPVFSVARAHFTDPAGKPFDRVVVRHPGAVSIVPVDTDGNAILVRQLRTAIWQSVLEAPAGTCDVDGERPEETARRELAEEAGFVSTALSLMARVHNSPGYSDQETWIYLATDLARCPTGRVGPEERWMTVERVPLARSAELIAGGQITDQTTALGLLLAVRALATG